MKRVLMISVAACVLFTVLAAPAAAAVSGGHHALPLGFLGINIPSPGEIIKKAIGALFHTIANALVPDWLKHAGISALQWLVALPNPANRHLWPTVGRLRSALTAVGIGLLPLTFTMAAGRYTLLGLGGGDGNALWAVARTAGAVGALVVYPWAFSTWITGINVITHAILSVPVVAEGLKRTVGLLFTGALFSGSDLFLVLLAIPAAILAIGLFLVKIAVLVLAGLLYVAGALVIAVSPMREGHFLLRAWLAAVSALALIPVGWCLIFALAGAFMLDVTSLGSLHGHTILGRSVVGVFAAIITFYFAVRWPFWLFASIRSRLGAPARTGGAAGAGGGGESRASTGSAGSGEVARATLARAAFATTGAAGVGARAVMRATPLVNRIPEGFLRAGAAGVAGRAGGAALNRAAAASGNPAAQASAGAVSGAGTRLAGAAVGGESAARQAVREGASVSGVIGAGVAGAAAGPGQQASAAGAAAVRRGAPGRDGRANRPRTPGEQTAHANNADGPAGARVAAVAAGEGGSPAGRVGHERHAVPLSEPGERARAVRSTEPGPTGPQRNVRRSARASGARPVRSGDAPPVRPQAPPPPAAPAPGPRDVASSEPPNEAAGERSKRTPADRPATHAQQPPAPRKPPAKPRSTPPGKRRKGR